MAKIKNAKVKSSSGSYERVFNHKQLGDLITKVHSTSISNGSELEKLILETVQKEWIVSDFDKFLDDYRKSPSGQDIVRIIPKKAIKSAKKLKDGEKSKKEKSFEPDFVVLKIDKTQECCYIIELKDGFAFDTKKVVGEREHLEKFENYIAKKIPYSTKIRFCCFNESDKEKIKHGLKGAFEIEEIMTGIEFCNLVSVNYEKIISIRKDDAKENIDYFISQLLKIDDVRQRILDFLAAK